MKNYTYNRNLDVADRTAMHFKGMMKSMFQGELCKECGMILSRNEKDCYGGKCGYCFKSVNLRGLDIAFRK